MKLWKYVLRSLFIFEKLHSSTTFGSYHEKLQIKSTSAHNLFLGQAYPELHVQASIWLIAIDHASFKFSVHDSHNLFSWYFLSFQGRLHKAEKPLS